MIGAVAKPSNSLNNSDKKKKVDNSTSNKEDIEWLNELFENCMAGDVATVSQLIDSKGTVDKSNDEDVTALQIASAHGLDEIVKLLIMKGAALEKSNRKKWTPLMQAARQGHSGVVSTLLQNHADVNARTRAGANAMLLAGRKGDLLTCKLLVSAGIDPSSQQSGDPCNPACDLTPMMVACLCGHYNLVKYFLECGEDVDQRSPSLGVSPLIMGALGGHENVVKLLVDQGANPNKTDINNRTALDFAITRNHRKIQSILGRITTVKSKAVLAYEDTKLDIIEATKKGNFMRVREILDKDISQRDASLPDEGATALMFAAISGRLDIVQELVERGCDVDKQDDVSGWTALMQAVYYGKKAVAKYLLSAGANVHLTAKNGCTAFDLLTLLDDVDTELYRILVSASFGNPDSSKNSTLTHGQQSEFSFFSTFRSGSQSRQNLKDLWLKVSDRFKHLKWGTNNVPSQTGHASSPTPHLSSSIGNLDRLKNVRNGFSSSPDSAFIRKKLHSTTLNVDSIMNSRNCMEKVSSISTINTLGAIKETESPISVNSFEDELDPMRDSFMYTMGNLGSRIGSSLKSDLPLFLPPPMSHCPASTMMPTISKHNHKKSTEASQSKQKNAFLPSLTRNRRKSGASVLTDLTNGHQLSPRTEGGVPGVLRSITRQQTTVSMATSSSVSPSASGGSDELRQGMAGANKNHLAMLQCLEKSKVNSSASSSTGTLTAGTDGHDKTPEVKKFTSALEHLETPLVHLNLSNFYPPMKFLGTNPINQSKSFSYAGHPNLNQSNFMTSSDDLGSILHKLSLEKYQPIFEEQEVDMETFLVLTDSNLKELGISNTESRHQLLSAINRINRSKKK